MNQLFKHLGYALLYGIIPFSVGFYLHLQFLPQENSLPIYEKPMAIERATAPELSQSSASVAPETPPTPPQTSNKVTGKVAGDRAPAPKPPSAKPPAVASCSGNLTTEFLCLLNNYRKQKGLSTLGYSQNLQAVANAHSAWMNQTSTLSHTNDQGQRFFDRCAQAGITCLAENLAEGYNTAPELLKAWQNNPSHHANLLGPYSKIGFGISGEYITLLFQ